MPNVNVAGATGVTACMASAVGASTAIGDLIHYTVHPNSIGTGQTFWSLPWFLWKMLTRMQLSATLIAGFAS